MYDRMKIFIMLNVILLLNIIGITMIKAGNEFGDMTVDISSPKPTILFEQIGSMFPTINFAHLRITTNLTQMEEAANATCSLEAIFRSFSNYTDNETLRTMIHSQAAAAFRSAERNITTRGKYPTKPFKAGIRSIVIGLGGLCDKSRAEVELVREIFRSVPVASTTNHRDQNENRVKRQALLIGGAIGFGLSLLFSGYSITEVFRLSSEVSALGENQRHIIAAMTSLTQAAIAMQSNFEKLADEIRQIKIGTTMRTLERQIVNTGQMAVIRAEEMKAHLSTICHGLYVGLAGRLSPMLIDPAGMKDAMRNLTSEAQRKGYDAVISILPHIFELQSSLYVHRSRDVIDTIVHIPLVATSSRRILYRRANIPYILPIGIDKLNEEAKRGGKEHAVWAIRETNNYVVTNKDRSISYELKERDLEDCLQISDTFFCRHLIRRRDSTTSSCEIALFHSQTKAINRLCEITLQTIAETAISVNNRQTILFATPQTIDVGCDFGNGTIYGPKQFKIKGLTKITLPRGGDCSATTRKHQWRADPFLEIEMTPRVLDMELNITDILEISIEDFIRNADKIDINQFEPVVLSKVTTELGKTTFLSFDTDNWRTWAICVTATLAISTCLCFGCYMYKKQKKEKQLEQRIERVQFIAPNPTQFIAPKPVIIETLDTLRRSPSTTSIWKKNKRYSVVPPSDKDQKAIEWRMQDFMEDEGSSGGQAGVQVRRKMLMIPCDDAQIEADAKHMMEAYNSARQMRNDGRRSN